MSPGPLVDSTSDGARIVCRPIRSRADERQREALWAIFGGREGGWPAGFAELVEEVHGIEFAPIDFEIADDLGRWRVEVPGKASGAPRR
jgi:hypothetical protein